MILYIGFFLNHKLQKCFWKSQIAKCFENKKLQKISLSDGRTYIPENKYFIFYCKNITTITILKNSRSIFIPSHQLILT
jgi:hypothetical protein